MLVNICLLPEMIIHWMVWMMLKLLLLRRAHIRRVLGLRDLLATHLQLLSRRLWKIALLVLN